MHLTRRALRARSGRGGRKKIHPRLRGKASEDRQSGKVIVSCAVITVPSNTLMMPLNERMPVILRDDQWPKWLGTVPAHEQEIKDMMRPYPVEDMTL